MQQLKGAHEAHESVAILFLSALTFLSAAWGGRLLTRGVHPAFIAFAE